MEEIIKKSLRYMTRKMKSFMIMFQSVVRNILLLTQSILICNKIIKSILKKDYLC
jgi:hypothetical protein